MTEPVLSVRNLRVEFPTRRGRLVAVDEVSFDIAPGEVLGVVGESGAGKSVTGAAIIGLLEPPGRIADGEVLLKGERIDDLTPRQLRRIRRTGRRRGVHRARGQGADRRKRRDQQQPPAARVRQPGQSSAPPRGSEADHPAPWFHAGARSVTRGLRKVCSRPGCGTKGRDGASKESKDAARSGPQPAGR